MAAPCSVPHSTKFHPAPCHRPHSAIVSMIASDILRHGMPAPGDSHIRERHEHVVAQKARQRHVPALPEVQDAGGAERRIEIVRQLDAEQQRHADRDIGIAGEVEEDLESEAESEPGGSIRATGLSRRPG